MLKKIILGIVVTIVLSVTAFGTVYAYQKEKARSSEALDNGILSPQYGSGPGEDCAGYKAGEQQECFKEEERIRNSLRQRENEDQECTGQDGEEHRWQHRYEYENHYSDEQGECEDSNRFKNQNSNSGNGRGRR
jgi:hypothetical protein